MSPTPPEVCKQIFVFASGLFAYVCQSWEPVKRSLVIDSHA